MRGKYKRKRLRKKYSETINYYRENPVKFPVKFTEDMRGCKLYDWQKILLIIANSILKSKNKTVIVSPNESQKQHTYNKALKYLTYDPAVKIQTDDKNCMIYFKNGSSIECITPKSESEIIRGKRADISHWHYDYEIPDNIDEILEPFIKNDTTKL